MASYTGVSGKKYILGQQLGVGGEGAVYELSGNSACVAKVYKTTRFKSESEKETMERKLKAMLAMNISATVDGLLRLAWPQDILYENNKIVGFVMPRVNTKYKIFDVYRTGKNSLRDLEYNNYTWKYSVQFAYNMAWVVNYLHQHNIVIGDLNQNNIAVDTKTGAVILIDCDSFDIRDPRTGEHFPCEVGLEEMLAPELQTVGKLSNGTFTKESDNFSLAIHIFRLLMNNEDPFGGKMTTNASVSGIPGNKAIINGECPYVRSVPGKTLLPRMPKLDILPPAIQQLFQRTFNYTATTALSKKNNRATAGEWVKELALLSAPEPNTYLRKCRDNSKHVYPAHNTSCPWCTIDKAGFISASTNTSNTQIGTNSVSGSTGYSSSQSRASGANKNKAKAVWAAIAIFAIAIITLIVLSGNRSTQRGTTPNADTPVNATSKPSGGDKSTNSNTPKPTLANGDADPEEFYLQLDSRRIKEEELYGFTKVQLQYIINSLYAMHGRIFQTPEYNEYYRSKSWYSPKNISDEEIVAEMSDIMLDNLDTLTAYRKKKGWKN